MSQLKTKITNALCVISGNISNDGLVASWINNINAPSTHQHVKSIFAVMKDFITNMGSDSVKVPEFNDLDKQNIDSLCLLVPTNNKVDIAVIAVALLIINDIEEIQDVDRYIQYLLNSSNHARLTYASYVSMLRHFDFNIYSLQNSQHRFSIFIETVDLLNEKMITVNPAIVQVIQDFHYRIQPPTHYSPAFTPMGPMPMQMHTPPPFGVPHTQGPNSSDAQLLSELQHRLNILSQQMAAIQQEQFRYIMPQPGMSAQHPMHTSGQMSVSNRMDPSPSFQQWTQRGANHTFKL